jgi:DNA topoisomerase VI subunit B
MSTRILTETPRRGKAHRLERAAFKTSRLLDFVGERELTAQIGHPADEWPAVILKELMDNAIDACEEAEVAPSLSIAVDTGKGTIAIADNGPGIDTATVDSILDYSVRVSSREAYVSPTRGAQGNALKTILAMGFALTGERGETIIESRGTRHSIVFAVDRIRQQPRIERTESQSPVKTGTAIMVNWPDSASSILEDAEDRFLQIASDFTWINPHLTLAIRWNDHTRKSAATDPAWKKWRPSDPTSAHWYDLPRFERYIAAHLARDEDLGRRRLVREFCSEFRGMSGTAKQKQILEAIGAARLTLADFAASGADINHAAARQLLAALQKETRPPKPRDLGVIGRDHIAHCFMTNGVRSETLRYKATIGDSDEGLPVVIETAFGYCPEMEGGRRIVVGVNHSVALGNPFRSFGRTGEGLEYLLAEQRAGRNEPIIFLLHLGCPRVEFSDRGKTALVLKEAAE